MNTGTLCQVTHHMQDLAPHLGKVEKVQRTLFLVDATYTSGDIVLQVHAEATVEKRFASLLDQLLTSSPKPAFKTLLDYAQMYVQQTVAIGNPDRQSYKMTAVGMDGTQANIKPHHTTDAVLPLANSGEYAFITYTRPGGDPDQECEGYVFMVPRSIVDDPLTMGPKMAGNAWPHNTLYFATQPVEAWIPGGYSPRVNKS